MAKTGRKIKLSSNLKPFVSRVVRSGDVQKAFGNQMRSHMRTCMSPIKGTHKQYTAAEIRKHMKYCADTAFTRNADGTAHLKNYTAKPAKQPKGERKNLDSF